VIQISYIIIVSNLAFFVHTVKKDNLCWYVYFLDNFSNWNILLMKLVTKYG